MQHAISLIAAMSNERLLQTWHALFPVVDWSEQCNGITVEDWAQLLYSELSKRGIAAN